MLGLFRVSTASLDRRGLSNWPSSGPDGRDGQVRTAPWQFTQEISGTIHDWLAPLRTLNIKETVSRLFMKIQAQTHPINI